MKSYSFKDIIGSLEAKIKDDLRVDSDNSNDTGIIPVVNTPIDGKIEDGDDNRNRQTNN